MYYSGFKTFFSGAVDVQPLEMSGRGRRCREPLATSMDDIGRDLFAHIEPLARACPYALFGHSMGALLALLCALRAREQRIALPEALFVSACAAPDDFLRDSRVPVSSLPPDRLWRYVENLGGLPPAVAASRELRRYLEPILYADFTALDTWRPADMEPLPVPITVFLGREDTLRESTARGWEKLTSREFSVHSFPGDHFYLQDNWGGLASLITRTLAPPGPNAPRRVTALSEERRGVDGVDA